VVLGRRLGSVRPLSFLPPSCRPFFALALRRFEQELTGPPPSFLSIDLFQIESSSNPQTSDADFQKRATHHRFQGRGDPKLYEQTLQHTGATTIDGHTIQFKITDVSHPTSRSTPVHKKLILLSFSLEGLLEPRELQLLRVSLPTRWEWDHRLPVRQQERLDLHPIR
jgi:hypothetical protein